MIDNYVNNNKLSVSNAIKMANDYADILGATTTIEDEKAREQAQSLITNWNDWSITGTFEL